MLHLLDISVILDTYQVWWSVILIEQLDLINQFDFVWWYEFYLVYILLDNIIIDLISSVVELSL